MKKFSLAIQISQKRELLATIFSAILSGVVSIDLTTSNKVSNERIFYTLQQWCTILIWKNAIQGSKMTKTRATSGHFEKWRLPPLCHPQPTSTIENPDLRINTVTTTYHTTFNHQNCHEITYAPGLLGGLLHFVRAGTLISDKCNHAGSSLCCHWGPIGKPYLGIRTGL